MVVPRSMQKEILISSHDSVLGAHLGVNKTFSKLKNKLYWYKMKESVELHINKCEKCARRKRPQKVPRSPLSQYTVGHPMDRISTDIMGPLPETEQGNRYILVVICNFTKWTECYAMKNQHACTIANKIVFEFLSRFGMCLDIHSDLGTNYQSKLFSEVCRMLEINQTRTSGYRPMANGAPERFNQVLQNMITTYINSNQTNWDENLNLITSAYRSCVHEGTGFTPNQLMLGREVILPVEVSLGCVPDNTMHQTVVDYVVDLKDNMSKTHEIARQSLHKNACRQKRDYDTRIHKTTFKEGDLVLCWDKSRKKGRCKKIESCIWKGPFLVTKVHCDLLFEIKEHQTSRPKIVHHDRLKRYHGRRVPQWLSTSVASNDNYNCKQPRRSSRKKNKTKPFQY